MNRILLPVIICISLMVSGCEVLFPPLGFKRIVDAGMDKNACWRYLINTYDTFELAIDKTSTVVPFLDGRQMTTVDNVILCYVPLMLYCTREFEPPEKKWNFVGELMRYSPPDHMMTPDHMITPEDFTKALVEELQEGHVFRQVILNDSSIKNDYIIRGKILDTTLRSSVYSYGFIGIGITLWPLGFPVGSFSNNLSVELTCIDNETGQLIFSKIYTAPEYTKVYWLYAQPNGCNYAKMIKPIYKQFVEELRIRLLIKKQSVPEPTKNTNT